MEKEDIKIIAITAIATAVLIAIECYRYGWWGIPIVVFGVGGGIGFGVLLIKWIMK
jgi:hypothetical protein